MSKFYLAARYSRRDELREHKLLLEEYGVEITSRWLDEKEPLDSQMGQHTTDFYIATATIDLEDIDRADAVIFFGENPREGIVRGGRHFEHGYAYAKGKKMFCIAWKENVFHYLPFMEHFESVNDLIKRKGWVKN